jgi:glycosyltransferase involved in cell wall biosynthesis
VLTIGAVEDYKGIEVFMRLAAQASSVWPSDEVKFVWAGGGTQLASCRERALREGLSNIVFLGAVEDTQALYSGSHIYLQPSHVESLGLALLDACRHGLPSLVSGAGGLPEVVEDGLTGFVVELGAHHAWFVALRSLVEDPSLRNRMGKEACESYRNRFGPQRWESKMMALHQRLLASK